MAGLTVQCEAVIWKFKTSHLQGLWRDDNSELLRFLLKLKPTATVTQFSLHHYRLCPSVTKHLNHSQWRRRGDEGATGQEWGDLEHDQGRDQGENVCYAQTFFLWHFGLSQMSCYIRIGLHYPATQSTAMADVAGGGETYEGAALPLLIKLQT